MPPSPQAGDGGILPSLLVGSQVAMPSASERQ